MNNQKFDIKLLLTGDDGIGKTSLYGRKGYKKFLVDYIPTVFDGFVDNIVTRDGYICNVAFWDSVADPQYNRLRPLSYPGTDVLAILFSISDRISFENCLKIWYPEAQQYSPNTPIILVGTKSDLKSSGITIDDLITYEEGVEMANKINAIQYIEISSKNDTNINELFDLVCKTVIAKRTNSTNQNSNLTQHQDTDSDNEIDNNNNNKKKCIIN